MQQEEILETNKIIAEFMGVLVNRRVIDGFNDDWGYQFDFNPHPNKNLEGPFWINENALQFHSDWSWIMSVYKECRKIKYSIGLKLEENKKANYLFDAVQLALLHADIEKLHIALYNFILWYNSQKQ